MANDLATTPTTLDQETMNSLIQTGDLTRLNEAQKSQYYLYMCNRLELDPATNPFAYLRLSNKLVLYALKSCTEQLRVNRGISVTSSKIEFLGDIVLCTVTGQDKTGRVDTGTGTVWIKGLAGDVYANAVLKAETKAKRRLTLSMSGLSVLDETEVETIPDAIKMASAPATTVTPPEPSALEKRAIKLAQSGKFKTEELEVLREEMNKGDDKAEKALEKFELELKNRT